MAGSAAAKVQAPRARALVAVLLSLLLALALVPRAPGGLSGPVGVWRAAIARDAARTRLPIAVQGPVSRILGRDDPSYRATWAGTGSFALRNRQQQLSAWFGPRGVLIRSDGAWLRLSLTGYGYGEVLHAVVPAGPRAEANRVVYRRHGLDEWYANGPLGLEQGFTVRARPAGREAGRLTLRLALSGNVHGVSSRGADAVTFGQRGTSLAYRGLVASDARGRPLPARIELRRGRLLLLRIDDRGARYPLWIDPFVQRATLSASDGDVSDGLGSSVAVSSDGSTVVLGAPNATVNGNAAQGAAYVFVRPAGGWASETEAAKLIASDGAANDNLGYSVGVSGDTVVAGAPSVTIGSPPEGAAYVFVKPSGGWTNETEAAKLTSSFVNPGEALGWSVAVSGNTVVAGAAGQGTAYVFVEPAGGWASETETAELTTEPTARFPEFPGISVAVSGSTVVTGVPGNEFGNGAAYVFVKPAGGWASETETAELTASDPSICSGQCASAGGDGLGSSVAVSTDGSTVLAAAPSNPANGPTPDDDYKGAAYVFVEPAAGWASETETAKLTSAEGAPYSFLGGSGVAVSGNTVVAGAAAGTYVFAEPAGGWHSETEMAKLAASGALAMAGDTLVVGRSVFVAPHATTTSASCAPATVAVGEPTTCTATVTDTSAGPSTPTGSVSFSSDASGGAFSNSDSCTLSPTATAGQASCRVIYTPGQMGSGTDTITAAYGGDGTHLASSAGTLVTVTKRATSIRVRCPARRPPRSCTATVTDVAAGAATAPTGIVTFTSTSRVASFTGNPCTLTGSGATARCSVTYKPPIRTWTITATYGGDSTHAASSAGAMRGPRCRWWCR